MSGLYGKDEQIQKTVEKDAVGLTSPGDYTFAIGRTYNKPDGKTGRNVIWTDLFLLNRTSKNGQMNFKMVNLEVIEGKQKMSLIVSPEGNPRVDGVIFRLRFPEPLGVDKETTRAFFANSRKKWARILGAWDEGTMTVDWGKIQNAAGKLATGTLVENGDFMNLDMKSVQIMEVGQIDLPSMLKCYETIEAEYARRKAAKAGEPPKTATTYKEDGDMSSAPPPPAKKDEDDPLPF